VLSGLAGPIAFKLHDLNAAGQEDLAHSHRFVTLVLFRFSIHFTGACAYANAAHQSTTDLSSRGLPGRAARCPRLADRPAARTDYGCRQVVPNPEMSSSIYTDGVSEAAGPGGSASMKTG